MIIQFVLNVKKFIIKESYLVCAWRWDLSNFNLVCDKQGLYLDVKYPHEERPRYFIDIKRQECTCMGFMFVGRCKHMREYKRKLHGLQLVWDETR